jgi:hypothetical protein
MINTVYTNYLTGGGPRIAPSMLFVVSSAYLNPMMIIIEDGVISFKRTFTENISVENSADTWINRLERHQLTKPIPVTIEENDDDGVIATFDAANISMSGDTLPAALLALSDYIEDIYETYAAEMHLGPEPMRRLGVLRGYLGEPRQ